MHFPLFEFVEPRHAFYGEIARLREIISQESRISDACGSFIDKKPDIHSEIKIARSPDGGLVFDRFYWSLQFNELGAPFSAYTLTLDRGMTEPLWQVFPEDSYLSGLQMLAEGAVDFDVLRYVPLRRFTFKETRNGHSRIGKFKRRSRFKDAYNRLAISAAVLQSQSPFFRVAAPAGISEEYALYYQDLLPGENVADLLDGSSSVSLMQQVGQLHRAMHTVDGRDLPLQTNEGFLRGAVSDIATIAFYIPERAERLKTYADLLTKTLPDDKMNRFGHGDFVCSQILKDGDRFSVIDFDLCSRLDPCREIAMFVASLIYDVQALHPPRSGEAEPWRSSFTDLELAYLDGYEFDLALRRRLVWHLICAELYYIALMLKKDRHEERAAAYRYDRLESLSEELR